MAKFVFVSTRIALGFNYNLLCDVILQNFIFICTQYSCFLHCELCQCVIEPIDANIQMKGLAKFYGNQGGGSLNSELRGIEILERFKSKI
jgi:hypothetical protein